MKIAVITCLFTKGDVDINSGHGAKVNAITRFLRFMLIKTILVAAFMAINSLPESFITAWTILTKMTAIV